MTLDGSLDTFGSLGSRDKGCSKTKNIGSGAADYSCLELGLLLVTTTIGVPGNGSTGRFAKLVADLLLPLLLLRRICGISAY